MQKYASDFQERYGLTKTTHEDNIQGSPTAHHHIATQSTNSVDLYQWVYSEERKGDPALKVCRLSSYTRHQLLTFAQNFIPKLKDHILMCLLHQGDDTTTHLFSSKERAKLIILQDKLYFHNTMSVNYHWGQGVVFWSSTSQIHGEEMGKVFTLFPPGSSQLHLKCSLPVYLQFTHPVIFKYIFNVFRIYCTCITPSTL